jgi:hypothetical protein
MGTFVVMRRLRRLNLILDHVDSAPEYLPDVDVAYDEEGVFELGSERWRIAATRRDQRPERPGPAVVWAVCEPADVEKGSARDRRLSGLYDQADD